MDKCEHGNLTAHGRDCPWCKITQQAERIAELEAENKQMRIAIRAAFNCGMVPKSSAKEGGAAKYSRQAEVADMLRSALMEKADE